MPSRYRTDRAPGSRHPGLVGASQRQELVSGNRSAACAQIYGPRLSIEIESHDHTEV